MYSIQEACRVLAGVDLVEGLAVPEIHTRLEIGLRLGDTGQGILSFYLAELADQGSNQVTGHRLAVQYAEGRLGMDRRRAGELIAVGRKLRDLPLIHQAFCDTEIGWSKVLQLVRVAVPEHEEAWLARAKILNCEELRRQVKLTRAGAKPRAPGDIRGTREPRFHVRITLGALPYETLQSAKRKLGDERGEIISDGAFLDIAAKMVLGTADDGMVPGRKPVDQSLYQIVLHDTAASASQGALLLDTQEVGLVPLKSADAIRCDATSFDANDPTEVEGTTPPWMRRRVLHRDGHRCRICGNTCDLEVHHIQFREHGGVTAMWNLLSGCNGCHSLIHADLIRVVGTRQDEARFVDAEGNPLARAGEYVAPEALLRLATPQRRSLPSPSASMPAVCEAIEDVPEVVDATWWQRHAEAIRMRDGKRLELVTGEPLADAESEPSPCPPRPAAEAFGDLVGLDDVVAELSTAAKGCAARDRAYPHTLFVGPAGTGKTTLARGVAGVAGSRLIQTNGPLVQDVLGLLGLLTQLGEGDMLFLDEIHTVPRSVLEILYEAMTDGSLSLTLHDGVRAKPVRLDLPRFTVLAATTAEDDLEDALISRFVTRIPLGLYAVEDLTRLVAAEGKRIDHAPTDVAARWIAERARGTPRAALRLLERVLNDVLGRGGTCLDQDSVRAALLRLGYDEQGLGPDERRYLDLLDRRCRPTALAQIARGLRLGQRMVRDRIEPELLDRGLVAITPRGRVAVPGGRAGYPAPDAHRAGYPAPDGQRAGYPALRYVRGRSPRDR